MTSLERRLYLLMRSENYIKEKVINKKGETGSLLSVDDEHVVVAYGDKEITYSTKVAFLNKFLSFVDPLLNRLMEEELNDKEREIKEKEDRLEKCRKDAIDITNRINEDYKKVAKKNNIMCFLFGGDFEYTPFKDFMKKNKHRIREKDIFVIFGHGYYYW